ELAETSYTLTTVDRKMDYWRSLLIQRSAAAEVRLFDLGAHIITRWRALADQRLRTLSARRRGHLRPSILWTTAPNDGVFFLLGLALLFAGINGRLTSGALVALLVAISQYDWHIHNLSWRLERFQRLWIDLGYISTLLTLEGEEPAQEMTPPLITQGVQFEAVGFTYPGGAPPILDGIDRQSRLGERSALVGENGAGKSTLVKLLLGLYQPTAGRISLDGADIQSIAPGAWRARVGGILQD